MLLLFAFLTFASAYPFDGYVTWDFYAAYKLDMVLGCFGKVGATPPSYFGPTGSNGYSCQPGEFSAASSGRLVTTELYQATTCSAPPSYFTTYAISTCVKDSSSRQSMLVTCGEAGATVERFSDESCKSRYGVSSIPFGCNLANQSIAGCYPAAAPGPDPSSSARTALITGAAVGGALGALLALGAAAYCWRRYACTPKSSLLSPGKGAEYRSF